jgi:hypothetical protein
VMITRLTIRLSSNYGPSPHFSNPNKYRWGFAQLPQVVIV